MELLQSTSMFKKALEWGADFMKVMSWRNLSIEPDKHVFIIPCAPWSLDNYGALIFCLQRRLHIFRKQGRSFSSRRDGIDTILDL